MATSKFEIHYTQIWFNSISKKQVVRRCIFCTDDFQVFLGYYRYLRYGGIPVRVHIQSIRMGEITLPFSKKTQRIKGVSKRLFNDWEANMFNLL